MGSFAEIQLGRILTERGDLDGAQVLLNRIGEEAIEHGFVENAFEVALSLADCSIRRGQPETAIVILDQAARSAGDEASIYAPTDARLRAVANEAEGRRSKALRYVNEGLGIARDSNSEYEVALLLAVRGRLSKPDEPSLSAQDEAEAAEIFERLDVRVVIANTDAVSG